MGLFLGACFLIVWIQKHFLIIYLHWDFDLLNSAHERIQSSCQEDRRILPSPVLRNVQFEGFDFLFWHCFGVIVWYPKCWILDAARRGAGSPQVLTKPARDDSFLNNCLLLSINCETSL